MQSGPQALIRPATRHDAAGIADVHVAAWRSAYADLLPAGFLTRMSTARTAAQMRGGLAAGRKAVVAEADGSVVGFATMGHPRAPGLADGEVETLYVLDDYRDQGLGRALLRAAAVQLEQEGCGSLFLWVLEQNHSRFFYERMGGRPVRRATTSVAGHSLMQVAYLWNPITPLTLAPRPG